MGAAQILQAVGIGLSLVFSLYAAIQTWRRDKVAKASHLIAQSNHWAATVFKYVEQELVAALEDRARVRQFYRNPFPSTEAKTAARVAIEDGRDQSDRCLHVIEALVGEVPALLSTKARRDRCSDSFWENAELSLSSVTAEQVVERYEGEAALYRKALQELAMTLSTERQQMLGGRKPPKQLGPGSSG